MEDTMATKKTTETVETAPEVAVPAAPVHATPAPARPGPLPLIGAAAGGALIAALLFGGGVLLGVNLPDGGGPQVGFGPGMQQGPMQPPTDGEQQRP